MTGTYTTSESETFSVVHAREIASRVAADLKGFQRRYDAPSDTTISQYQGELVELLRNNVLGEVVYGFQRQGRWTVAAVRYKALADGTLTSDDPGQIDASADIAGASFTSFLTYNDRWEKLSPGEREQIRKACPFQRVDGTSPPLEKGYWVDDLKYGAGGRALSRSTIRS